MIKGKKMGKFEYIIKEIKKLNPFLWAEEKDAKEWNTHCKIKLINAYKEYVQSDKRVHKILKRKYLLNNKTKVEK